MKEGYGTAQGLELQEGEIVEMVSEYECGSAKADNVRKVREVATGVVVTAPKSRKASTEILILSTNEGGKWSKVGGRESIWYGFCNFRRLVTADKLMPIVGRLILEIEALKRT